MAWHREEPSASEEYHPRTVDNDRCIRFEQTGTHTKGVVTTFRLAWKWREFKVSAEGPFQFAPGRPSAWMNVKVHFLDPARRAFIGEQTTDEDVVRTAIEALVVHGRNGEGLRHPDGDPWVLHQRRIHLRDQSGSLQVRDASDDEQLVFSEQRERLYSII